MGALTTFADNKLVAHLFGAVTYTPPATLYFGLSTTTITKAGGNITEPSGNGYARKGATNNTTNFPAPANGAGVNGADVNFDAATGAWGTCTDFFIADAVTGGNILAYGVLPTSKTPTNGDTLYFPAGQLSYSIV